MSDTKISALPVATSPLTGAELLPLVQAGASVRAPVSAINFGLTAPTYAAARLLSGVTTGDRLQVLGRTSQSDGGQGLFTWVAGGSTTIDDGIELQATGGIWRRERTKPGFLDITWFGADATGVANSTTAVQNAINALATGEGTVSFPPNSTFKMVGGVTVAQKNVWLVGGGLGTHINFAPTANGSLFKYSAGAAVIYGGRISGMSICSADTTFTKTAIELSDTSAFTIEDVVVGCSGTNPWNGGSAVGPDTQNGSIGIRCRGRELTAVSRVTITADRPLVISKNPNVAAGNEVADHDHFSDLYLLNIYAGANVGPLIWVDDGVVLSNTTFDGAQAWVGGTYGFYWNDTTSAVAAQNLSIRNARWEQASGTTGYMVWINPNSLLIQLNLQNLYGGLTTNGIRLRNVTDFTLSSVFYVGTQTAFDIDSSNSIGVLDDVHANNGAATVSISPLRTTGTYFTGIIPTTLTLTGIGNPSLPFTVSQSGIPVGMPPSGYIDATGHLVIGQHPLSAQTVTFSATSGSVTATFSAATLTGTSAGDVNRYIIIFDSPNYVTCKITASTSTTVATGTLSATLSTAGPWANANLWVSGTAAATNTVGVNPATIATVTITGTAGQFAGTLTGFVVGQALTLSGTYGGTGSITGYVNPTTYLVSATDGTSTFTLTTQTGAALVTTAGTPTGITYTPGQMFSAQLPRTYANAYLWFPASSPIGVAGVYPCQMASPVTGVCYNSALTTGAPVIKTSPAFSGLTPAQYVQTAGAYQNVLPQIVIPANSLGASGTADIDICEANNNSAGSKIMQPIAEGISLGTAYIYTTGLFGRQLIKFWNTGITNAQIAETTSAGGGGVGTGIQSNTGTGVTSSNTNFSIQIQLATSQFDNAFAEFYSLKVSPSN